MPKSHTFNDWVYGQSKEHAAFYIVIQQATQSLQHKIKLDCITENISAQHISYLNIWLQGKYCVTFH
jgi:hypothetical protein